MSEWHYKLGEVEHGPVSFRELVELTRAGTVTETVPVRRADSRAWTHAWTVPMLFAAAARAAAPAGEVQAEPPARSVGALAPAAKPPRSRIGQPPSAALRSVVTAASSIAVTLGFYRWWCLWRLRVPLLLGPDEPLHGYRFPLVGNCSALECALFHLDLAVVIAAVTWFGLAFVEKRWKRYSTPTTAARRANELA